MKNVLKVILEVVLEVADRKGISVGMWPVLLVVTILGSTSLGLGTQFIYDLTGDLGANTDRESLNRLGERTQDKCNAIRENSDTDPLIVDGVGFNQIEELTVEDVDGGSSRYQLQFQNQEPASYLIEGCTMELGFNSIEPGIWNFTVEESQNNADISVEVEQQ